MRPFRKEKIASVIRQVVSEAIAHKLHDPRVDVLTTVTKVEMTDDLLIAKVFLTVGSGDAVERRTLQGVKSAGGYLQRQVAKELQIKHCPTLEFKVDREEKASRETLSLLAENLRENPTLTDPIEEPDEEGVEPSEEPGEDGNAVVTDETEETDS